MSPERGPAGTWEYLAFWDGGAMALEATLAGMPAADTDAALLLMDEMSGELHYAVGTGTWYIWDGRCHRPDESDSAGKLVIALGVRLRRMLEVARGYVATRVSAGLPADVADVPRRRAFEQAWEPWKAAEKYAAGLARSAGISALKTVLATVCGCEDEDMAERAPGWLNVANGTVDLATKGGHRHAPADMLTYCLDDPLDLQARCPRFLALVHRMCGGDAEVTWYFIKLLGYALLGDNREQKIIFISGPTGSGKSQVLRIVSEVLGPLAHAGQADLITVVRHGRNARTENSVRGVRFVPITETSQWMNIDEAQVKRLTGEAVISVDQHYAKSELKTPVTWTIFVATNQMPTLTNFDAAMRRRVIVIPGGPGLLEAEMDPRIAEGILSVERKGILALLVKACGEYFRSGLDMPLAVEVMTAAYASGQNTVGNFIADTMIIGGWGNGVPQHEAWKIYQDWSRGSSHLGRNEFYEQMRKQPGIGYNEPMRRFSNLAWNPDWAARVG